MIDLITVSIEVKLSQICTKLAFSNFVFLFLIQMKLIKKNFVCINKRYNLNSNAAKQYYGTIKTLHILMLLNHLKYLAYKLISY